MEPIAGVVVISFLLLVMIIAGNDKEKFNNKKLITTLTVLGVAFGLFAIAMSKPGQKYLKQQVASSDSKPSNSKISQAPEVEELERNAKTVLDNITNQYGYSRFIETWGMGTQGLFIPVNAWKSLPPDEQNLLIAYAKHKGLKAIIVGRQISADNMYVDYTVWER